MNICFVFEGIPHYYVYILDELNKHHNIFVILPQKDDYFKSEGIKTSEDGTFKRFYLKKKKTFYKKDFFIGFNDCIKDIKPDLLIFPWPYFLQLLFNPFLYKFLRKNEIKIGTKEIPFFTPFKEEKLRDFKARTVSSLMSEKIIRSWIHFKTMKLIRRIIYSNYIDFTFNYLQEGKKLMHGYGLEQERIFVTSNSHNTQDTFKAVIKANQDGGVPKKANRIVHIGRLAKWKRVDLLIQAVNELVGRYPDIELLIIGDGQEINNLKALTKSFNIEKNITFIGSVYNKVMIAKYLLSSEIYILAGMGGLSINEAMCHSLPIICSTCDGTEKELVFEGRNGSYFQKDDLVTLVDTIDKLLKNKAELSKMGAESLKIVEENINEQKVIDNYLSAFKIIENLPYEK